MKKSKVNLILCTILLISFLLRILRFDYPPNFIFDEIYYPFTAKEYLKGNKEAWEWWPVAQGGAYAWVNPPLPQEMMALSMFIFKNQSAWVWRLPGVLLGILSIYLVFVLGKNFFGERVGILSAFIFSVDGLNFVQSRIGMPDIYLVAFILLSLVFFVKNKLLFSAIFLGLAIASKWSAIYLLLVFVLLLIKQHQLKKIIIYLMVIPLIYFLIYLPFFFYGHDIGQFINLLKQEWWYHTNLKATHSYASPFWSWPLNLYPVWYFVDYKMDKIANIFASGNPLVFWGGTLSIILTIINYLKKRSDDLLIILLGFFLLWLPWALSPRIMFLYYFSPSVPFLSLALGYQLNKLLGQKNGQFILLIISFLMFLSFLALYPFLTGIPLPKDWVKLFFLTILAKNPFG